MTNAEQDRRKGRTMQKNARRHYKIGRYYTLPINYCDTMGRDGHYHKTVDRKCRCVGMTKRFGIFETPTGSKVTFRWFELGSFIEPVPLVEEEVVE